MQGQEIVQLEQPTRTSETTEEMFGLSPVNNNDKKKQTSISVSQEKNKTKKQGPDWQTGI